MKTYKNWNDEAIGFAPFFQDCLGVYRIARYQDGEIDTVIEYLAFKTLSDCEAACLNMLDLYLS